jgi:hypothetical protein
MGEVYKARDVRLGRDVGVKVMPASFAADCRNGSKASGRGHKTTPPSTEARSFRRNSSAVTSDPHKSSWLHRFHALAYCASRTPLQRAGISNSLLGIDAGQPV